MAIEDDVNRELREFKRFTGDGLPGEPTGAPLPVGDPSSGVHNPKKSGLRALLGSLLDAVSIYVDQAQAWAEAAELIALPDGSITAAKLSDDTDELIAIRDKIGAGTGSGSSAGGVGLLALALSEATSAHVSLGATFADGFKSLGMVDVAGATNLNSSESGYLAPVTTAGANFLPLMTAATTSGVTISDSGNSSSGTAGWKTADRNVATYWQSGTGGGLSANSWVKADFGASVQIGSYSLTSGPTPGGYHPTAHKLQYSSDNTSWSDADSRTGQTYGVEEKKSFSLSSPISARYWRLLVVTGESSTIVILTEWEMFAVGSTGNLAVASQILPVSFLPASIAGQVRAVAVDAVTLNTDLFLDVRRDQADSWEEAVLNLDFMDGGVSVLKFAALDVSGGGADEEPQWRIRTANGKRVKVDGIVLEFSA